MSFRTISAILRGKWLIDKQWASQHLPLIVKMLNGERADFGQEKDEERNPVKILSNRAASVYQVSYYSDLSRLPSGSIAMLDINGPITKYGDICSYGSIDHTATLNRLGAAPNVEGVILNIDSPGGEVSGTAMLADAIKSLGTKKPVVAMIDNGIAASAAMWIASASNEIYTTQKIDMVGSIGVYTTLVDWYGYLEKEGLKVRDIYAPQSTDKNLDYREALKGNDDLVKDELKVLADEFISTIAKNRAGKIQGNDWSTGKMYYSKEAIRLGLIDGQKSFNQVVGRINKLISTKKTNNTMAFEKTLKAANATEFELVDDIGFGLTEAQLTAVENTLATNEQTTVQREGEISSLKQELGAEKLISKKASDDLAAANIKIGEQQAEIAALKKSPAAEFTNTVKNGSDKHAHEQEKTNKYLTSADEEAIEMRKKLGY